MKVSFTGNYLYTYKDITTRNKAYEQMRKAQNDMLSSNSFDIFNIGKDQILLLNGLDYKDYRQSIAFNNMVNIKGDNVNLQYLNALKDKAVNVDLRRINLDPQYKPPVRI
jgi:hypothetical protein